MHSCYNRLVIGKRVHHRVRISAELIYTPRTKGSISTRSDPTAPDLSGPGRVDMFTCPVGAARAQQHLLLLLRRERRAELKHDMYLIF